MIRRGSDCWEACSDPVQLFLRSQVAAVLYGITVTPTRGNPVISTAAADGDSRRETYRSFSAALARPTVEFIHAPPYLFIPPHHNNIAIYSLLLTAQFIHHWALARGHPAHSDPRPPTIMINPQS